MTPAPDWLKPYDFTTWNETDVRENIVAPMLRGFGYQKNSASDIITEQWLKYDRLALGRKKPTDPKLRGKVDYILEVDKRLRVVIETKSPAADISQDDRDQAWSYAAHTEVRAVYFLVTNGRAFELFRSQDAPAVGAVLSCSYEKLAEMLTALSNAIGPDSLKRDFQAFVLDTGKPLGHGLRSFAKIVNGIFTITGAAQIPNVDHRSMIGFRNTISEGALQRDGERLAAYLKLRPPFAQMETVLEQLRLETFEIESPEPELSHDPAKPTTFTARQDWTFPKGMTLHGIPPSSIVLPYDIPIKSVTSARGTLRGDKFAGAARIEYVTPFPFMPAYWVQGDFEAVLS